MELSIIKKTKEKENFYSRKMNVAAYVRVSTEQEKQLYSYESQQKYYYEKITRNSNWTLVGIFSDYGISGTSLENRSEFIKMIQMVFDKKIDFIFTKSISRFARNTRDALEIVRKLKSLGVGIYFEEEHINTLKLQSELLLTILCSAAEQESKNISNHTKLAYSMKVERGELAIYRKVYGYNVNSKNKSIKINKREAKVVKMIYELYLDNKSVSKVAHILNSNKIKCPFKRNKWNYQNTIKILINEYYIGDIYQGEDKKHKIFNHHEAIIDRNDFFKVKSMINNKIKYKKNLDRMQLNIYCGFCGSLCRCLKQQGGTVYYKCQKYINMNTCSNSVYIGKKLLIYCFEDLLNKLVQEKYRKKFLYDSNYIAQKKHKLKTKEQVLITKLSNLTEQLLNKKISIHTYNNKKESLNNEIEKINLELKEINEFKEKFINLKSTIETILFKIDNFHDNSLNFNEKLFYELIHHVIIGGVSEKGYKLPYMIRFVFVK